MTTYLAKAVAALSLFMLGAGLVAFIVWLNLNYWTGLGSGNGWQILCSVLDVVLLAAAPFVIVFGLGALASWAWNTLTS